MDLNRFYCRCGIHSWKERECTPEEENRINKDRSRYSQLAIYHIRECQDCDKTQYKNWFGGWYTP